MEIQLSKILKDLRQKNNKTQDDLADHLGITSQAVSKWERCEGYPDITLLPQIAAFFHVSVDTLLGVDEIARQVRIDEITAEYNIEPESMKLRLHRIKGKIIDGAVPFLKEYEFNRQLCRVG